MENQRRLLAALILVPALALVTACSSEGASTEEPESSSAATVETGAEAPAGEYVPNHIILGTDGIQVTPSVQCSIFDENTVSIAGVGKNDSSVEFAFDVFSADDVLLSLTTADGVQWSPSGTLSYRVETETRVTGLTELVAETGGDAVPVSFAFSCE